MKKDYNNLQIKYSDLNKKFVNFDRENKNKNIIKNNNDFELIHLKESQSKLLHEKLQIEMENEKNKQDLKILQVENNSLKNEINTIKDHNQIKQTQSENDISIK